MPKGSSHYTHGRYPKDKVYKGRYNSHFGNIQYFSRHFKILLDRLNIYIRYFIFKLKEKINTKLHKTQCGFYLNVS